MVTKSKLDRQNLFSENGSEQHEDAASIETDETELYIYHPYAAIRTATDFAMSRFPDPRL
jgi:hypothetical protein